MNDADYALGYAEAELRRLTTQARLVDPITRRFLEAAGTGNGMRVLDIGSGARDVALLCGELVGPTGGGRCPSAAWCTPCFVVRRCQFAVTDPENGGGYWIGAASGGGRETRD